jgi:hypothetical protein
VAAALTSPGADRVRRPVARDRIVLVEWDNTAFTGWARRWMTLAGFQGTEVPAGRVEEVLALWREPVPGTWRRDRDAALANRDTRYRRTHTGGVRIPRGEHKIEHDILTPDPDRDRTTFLGACLVDGVNALPLAKDAAGGRAGNVEADMLLLLRDEERYRQALVEVKVESNHPWYAAVEGLRQLRLLSENDPRLFHARRPDLDLPARLPTTLVILAPEAFYSARGRNLASMRPTRTLLERMRADEAVDARLATWDRTARVVAAVP